MTDIDCSTRLAREFAVTSASLLGHSSLENTVQAVADMAPDAVPGAEAAAVCVLRRGVLETPSFSDDLGLDREAIRAVLTEGPYVRAAAEGRTVLVEDLAEESLRSAFAFQAADLGVRSMVAVPLHLSAGVRGALVVLSRKPETFDGAVIERAEIYAAHASAALDTARSADSLRDAVRTRQVIGEATGILMERHRIDDGRAFDMLVRASQNLNVKLKAVAERVVQTGQDPHTLGRPDLPARRTAPAGRPLRGAGMRRTDTLNDKDALDK
ncbi:GAF and ANTAR domain-containing protein [Actinospica sp. MGRD01-02]|uniref:GAF and ANTAR domain-containing protein n=1 Tax=Actinospica acidithermotolerans TaxID=2828514 RepID=A0A941E7U1_9ACTN|nr:GAF and ANTAR domain-containing protein [Actinospica acidithermotolerans]MBR7826671.1 GAF and ANTAR domain-containing protein [Actinospica acidithermotolerans]